jgi:outer membrane protein OmpA-like peptidoglycan-associated protein
MRKVCIFLAILLLGFTFIHASPTIKGNKGVLRVYAADPEMYTARRPTLFLGFYQGYATQNDSSELHYGFNLTLLVGSRYEFSYLIENMTSDWTFRDQPLTNEFKLKIVTIKTPFVKISPLGEVGFPIGGESGNADPHYGGRLLTTFDLGAARKILPFRLHANAGYIVQGDNSTIPVSGALVYPTKYLDFFVEAGIPDVDNTDFMIFTPGIKFKFAGIRVTGGYDFNTEGPPDNKFNFMFSWLGPFTGIQVVPEIGIGKIKGYVYDTETNDPVEADIVIEGDINRVSESGTDGNFEVEELPPGEYTVIATAEGYENEIQETEVLRGETQKLSIGLNPIERIGTFAGKVIDKDTKDPLYAQLRISPVDSILLTDSLSGEFETDLEEDSYDVAVTKDGYHPEQDKITITHEKTTERIYELMRMEKIGTFKGKVVDDATDDPLRALVKVKDTAILTNEETGEFSSSFEEGDYPVSVTKEGYHDLYDTVTIKTDSVTEREYRLTKVAVVEITFGDVLFDFDKYYIKKKYRPLLDSLVDFINDSPDRVIIKLEGHCCSIGTDQYNIGLSQRRVNSVKQYLLNKGVDENRIETAYFGESRPKEDNSTKEGRIKNRRVEIKKKENE